MLASVIGWKETRALIHVRKRKDNPEAADESVTPAAEPSGDSAPG